MAQRVFRIPAQPLPNALDEFIRQSGMQVRAEGEVPAVHSPGVVGRFTAPEALRRLVAGTDLTRRGGGQRTLALRPVSGAYELEPVEVVAPRATSDERDLDGHAHPHAAA